MKKETTGTDQILGAQYSFFLQDPGTQGSDNPRPAITVHSSNSNAEKFQFSRIVLPPKKLLFQAYEMWVVSRNKYLTLLKFNEFKFQKHKVLLATILDSTVI